MKLMSAAQLQQWDAYTIAQEPITSIDLMERAAKACAAWLTANGKVNTAVKIFCANGNNGGDGLAIARLLLGKKIRVSVYILEFGTPGTADFQTNLQRLHTLTTDIIFIQSADYFPSINEDDTVIDALFGSGLNRPLKDLANELVSYINIHSLCTIAIDLPSGMCIDKSCKDEMVIKANHTLTFQSLKLCLLAAENAALFGEVHVLDISLHPKFIPTVDGGLSTIEKAFISSLLKPRNTFAHKGSFGHALIIAGNKGKMGAAVLAAKACLRSGVGLLTMNVPEQGLNILQSSVFEAMCLAREEENINWEKYTAIGIGPGIGTDPASQNLVETVLHQSKQAMIIDADALNCISMNKDNGWVEKITSNAVITPHPKEFDRLFGNHKNEFDRWDKAIQISQQKGFIIILKGHHTLIAKEGKGWFNTTGNAGMAKGGSGDVLTGIITALLAQKYTALNAALVGVYLHGLAGDITLKHQAIESMLPGDLIENIGNSFIELRK